METNDRPRGLIHYQRSRDGKKEQKEKVKDEENEQETTHEENF
jgi:hypothetical protein